eukprot:4400709-Alexandrium_andersonii.AAC.1
MIGYDEGMADAGAAAGGPGDGRLRHGGAVLPRLPAREALPAHACHDGRTRAASCEAGSRRGAGARVGKRASAASE